MKCINFLLQILKVLSVFIVITFAISQNHAFSQNLNYLYDNQNRLIQIIYPDSSGIVYSYDKNGNRILSDRFLSPASFPVELLTFNGEAIENSFIRLNWQTATEINNKGFSLERSMNGIEFSDISWIEGYGNSTQIQSYQFDDESVTPGNTYYYRLRQEDFSGSSSYSNIVEVWLGSRSFFSFKVYPNPTPNQFYLDIRNHTTEMETLFFTIVDNNGRLVSSISESIDAKDGRLISFDLSSQSVGLYLLKISHKDIIIRTEAILLN